VFLAWDSAIGDGYELQILDSYGNETYMNGMAGSIYKQSIPLANPTRPPGEWQTYDVVWTAPRFHDDGSLASPARPQPADQLPEHLGAAPAVEAEERISHETRPREPGT
jgi:hypothetical protein